MQFIHLHIINETLPIHYYLDFMQFFDLGKLYCVHIYLKYVKFWISFKFYLTIYFHVNFFCRLQNLFLAFLLCNSGCCWWMQQLFDAFQNLLSVESQTIFAVEAAFRIFGKLITLIHKTKNLGGQNTQY